MVRSMSLGFNYSNIYIPVISVGYLQYTEVPRFEIFLLFQRSMFRCPRICKPYIHIGFRSCTLATCYALVFFNLVFLPSNMFSCVMTTSFLFLFLINMFSSFEFHFKTHSQVVGTICMWFGRTDDPVCEMNIRWFYFFYFCSPFSVSPQILLVAFYGFFHSSSNDKWSCTTLKVAVLTLFPINVCTQYYIIPPVELFRLWRLGWVGLCCQDCFICDV